MPTSRCWPRFLALAALGLAGPLHFSAGDPSTDRDSRIAECAARVYAVDDLVGSEGANADLPSLVEVIRGCVQPSSWQEVGGEAAIAVSPLPGRPALVVRQTAAGHREVADLLAGIRHAVGAAAQGKEPQGYVRVPSTTDAERRIRDALDRPLGCDFHETPLNTAAGFLARKAKIRVRLDRKALEEVGIGIDTPRTLRVSGITLRSLLWLLLRDLDLTFEVRKDCLLITTPEETETRLKTALFAVPDLAMLPDASGGEVCDFAPLMDLVTATVMPTCWDDVGGPGSVYPLSAGKARLLVVWQTEYAFERIADLLFALRKVARQQAAGEVLEPVMVVSAWERTPAAEAIDKALDKRFSFQFIETPLEKVVAQIGRKAGINILLDRRSLDDVGVGPDVPVTKDIKDMPLRQSLRLLLRELDLTFIIQDEVLTITTPEEAESCMLTGFYPAADLAAVRDGSGKVRHNYGPLTELITAVVKPTMWDEVGGPGSISPLRLKNIDALVVSQDPDVHPEVTGFLRSLRRVAKSSADDRHAEPRPPVFFLPGEDTPRAAAIRKALGQPVSLELHKTPLWDVVDHLKDTCKIEIQIDKRGLDDIGIGTDVPVSIRVKGVSLRSALRLMLRPLDLDYTTRDEVLLITSAEEAEWRLPDRIYPVGDLIAAINNAEGEPCDFEPLVDAITATVAPSSWADVGGVGSIMPWLGGGSRALVITQSEEIHEQILQLLTDLRRARTASPPGEAVLSGRGKR